VIRATFEIRPVGAVDTLVAITSTGVPDDPGGAQPSVEVDGELVTLTYPDANWGGDVSLLVSSLLAGEWADLAVFERCRLVALELPDGLLPGPAFDAADGVLVGAIIKPSLGLTPGEAAATAAELAGGGADLLKDDELLGDRPWSPLEERVRAVTAAIPEHVRYAANVTGSADGLLRRAERAVELGAGAVMVNALAQGLDSVRLLREAELGVPLFAHRVGAALWMRGEVGVAPGVVAQMTRLAGSDYILVASFTGRMADSPDDVRAQIAACHAGPLRSTAVLGAGVGPENAAAQVEAAGGRSGLMVLLGSATYAYPGGPREAVAATVAAVRP
jgi:ribulose 1,5-bisphosphate carboxylase large subunit-like protein